MAILLKKMTIFGNFFKQKCKIFDIQMTIFRRVRSEPLWGQIWHQCSQFRVMFYLPFFAPGIFDCDSFLLPANDPRFSFFACFASSSFFSFSSYRKTELSRFNRNTQIKIIEKKLKRSEKYYTLSFCECRFSLVRFKTAPWTL